MTTVSQPLTISIRDVNDAPSFTDAPYSVSVNENEAAGAVYTVSALDPDSGKFFGKWVEKEDSNSSVLALFKFIPARCSTKLVSS